MSERHTFTPEEIQELSEGIQKWASNFFSSENNRLTPHNAMNTKRVTELMQTAMMQMFTQNPMELWQSNMRLWQSYANIWQNMVMNMFNPESGGNEQSRQGSTDRRFQGEAWEKQPYFNFIKECYLATAEHINESVSRIEGLDDKTVREIEFYTRQLTDALSPSNFVMTNPEVLEETINSKGQNLVKGFQNMLEDMNRNDGAGILSMKLTDIDQFKIGENIAATPGEVVYQNRLFQLIQYRPQTEQVYERPLLIIPPFINKYYILDLSQKKSFVDWIVKQGYTLFMISWVNPDASYRDTQFQDYMLEGLLPAFDQVLEITGQKDMNVIGYCIGGTLLAATLSYLKQQNRDHIINSVTYFTTLIDFSDPGELGVFLSEQQVDDIIREMNDMGYLDGRRLAASFNLLRSNDLVWNYYVNNYLCGKEPFPFDLLFWNCDSTNMAAASHAFYLKEMYVNNSLSKPNAINFNGVDIDVTRVDIPSVFISAEKDHIAPWKGTYYSARLLSGEIDFILGGSGHIAGIVNPPSKNKYGFKTNTRLYDTPEEWEENATAHEGSWWPYWEENWLRPRAGQQITALAPGNGKVTPIEPAPGSYVKKSILNQE